ncbi:hypothetical protein GCM10010277_72710 [Streptomyces longisporoflavus]|nr:hypothetical protein GCM10010277_72710 [Streptomyces longisporoflavus]
MPPCREVRIAGSAMFTADTSTVMTVKPRREARRARAGAGAEGAQADAEGPDAAESGAQAAEADAERAEVAEADGVGGGGMFGELL